PLGLDIPERAWKGRDPTYSHLRVFGSKAYMHVPKEQRSKLDSKTNPCVFVGYGDEEYGYRLYDPEKKKVVRSRDVVFFEHEKGADLLSTRYTSTSELFLDTTNDSTSIPSVIQPTNVNVEDVLDDVHDDVGEIQPDGNVPDHVDDDNIDESSSDEEIHEEDVHEEVIHEEVHEQGEQPTPQVEDTQVRRSTRERKPSTRYPSSEFILVSEDGEPENYQEVLSHDEKDQWLDAMKEEMNSLKKNEIYKLVKPPKGKKVLRNRWVFKYKKNGDKILKLKSRLVLKLCNQKKGIDFDEIFSPVVKMTSIRTVLGLAASLDLELEQLDVKISFLHGDLHEEIYMEQPE
ncbi:hypothetical protein NP118_23750, partial [Salmonella enterica]|nr:hypothetical protein [Salmonella enterica]